MRKQRLAVVYQLECEVVTRSDARKVIQSMLLLLAFIIPALLVLAVLLYGVKCMLGINIFESKHLLDFVQ